MYVKRNISARLILKFTWAHLLFYIGYSTFIVWMFHFLQHMDINIELPFLPMSVIGIVVAFYIGFKNSQAYDRFWEGRKIWGGIVNSGRTWAIQVMSYITNLHATEAASEEELTQIHREFIYRHMAWMNALRINLRKPTSFSIKLGKKARSFTEKVQEEHAWQEAVHCFLREDEDKKAHHSTNPPAQIIRVQSEKIKALTQRGLIDDFRHMELMHTLEEFYNLQGKCERIKNTPFPRQYGYFSKVFTWIFVLLLPLGLVGEFASMGHGYISLAIPFYVLIAWVFMTMENIGDNSEDPFEGNMNDVPMTSLCRIFKRNAGRRRYSGKDTTCGRGFALVKGEG